jgi:hypothetical protein
MCHGAPPSAIQVPSGPGQMTLKMARPIVSVTDEACALYRAKNAMDLMDDQKTIDTVATKQ